MLTTLFLVKFLFQAVYLEFCISRVLAGNRWPTATENGGSLRKRHGQGLRKPVGPCSTGAGGQGSMPLPLLGLKGKERGGAWNPERQQHGEGHLPGAVALSRVLQGPTPNRTRTLVCPREFVHLHSSFSKVFQFRQ